MRVLPLLLPALALGSKKLDFLFTDCDNYCQSENEFSFTFTKQACPHGGPRADDGGFLDDECIEDDLTIEYVAVNGDKVKRKTTLKEAMRVCGNEKIVEMDDGKMWYSPEYEYRESVLQCRDGHGDGQGWPGDCEDCGKPSKDATTDDVSYTECLQAAYDKCVNDEPTTDKCIQAEKDNDTGYLCTFCKDCDTGEPKKTCLKYEHIYQSAAQSCFDDDSKAGYQACLDRAQEVLALRTKERERICDKTFILERTELPCSAMGGIGYVGCCCMVKGAMIQHPPDAQCIDRAKFTECQTWKGLGYCKPNHGYYNYMSEHCPLSCGICAEVAPDGKKDPWDYSDEMAPMNDYAEYEAECAKAGVNQDKDTCQALSGKYKKKKCIAAKGKKISCKNATGNPAVCRALGCNLVMTFEDKLECGGKPMNLSK